MRRTPRALALTRHRVWQSPFSSRTRVAAAEPASPDSVGSLVAAIANVNQKLQELGAAVQAQQEGVNKAIVDVQTARDNAAAAQQDVDASRRAVDDSDGRDHVRATAVRHLRGVDLRQRALEFIPDGGRPRRHDRHRLGRTDARHQRTAGRHRSAAGTHRAGQQGIRGPAGQAERRSGHGRRADQPGRRGVGAEVGPADIRRPAGSAEPADRRSATPRRPSSRRPAQWSAPATGQPKPAAPLANPSTDWDRAPGTPTPAAG